jgi:hypothetical protein
LVATKSVTVRVKAEARNEKNWEHSLGPLAWNSDVGEAEYRETLVDGTRVMNRVGSGERDFVAIIFHHFVEDAAGRIGRIKEVAY